MGDGPGVGGPPERESEEESAPQSTRRCGAPTLLPMDASCLLPPPPLVRRGPMGGAVAAAAIEGGGSLQSALLGPSLQCFEAATLGMPLEVGDCGACKERAAAERAAAALGRPPPQPLSSSLQVWKTYLGRNRGVSTLQAVRDIYAGGGASAFWAGTGAKMAESASKGLILVVAKESLLGGLNAAGVSPGKRRGSRTREEPDQGDMTRQQTSYSSLKLTAGAFARPP